MKRILVVVLLLALTLTGCSSGEEIINSDKLVEKIDGLVQEKVEVFVNEVTNLENKISNLENQVVNLENQISNSNWDVASGISTTNNNVEQQSSDSTAEFKGNFYSKAEYMDGVYEVTGVYASKKIKTVSEGSSYVSERDAEGTYYIVEVNIVNNSKSEINTRGEFTSYVQLVESDGTMNKLSRTEGQIVGIDNGTGHVVLSRDDNFYSSIKPKFSKKATFIFDVANPDANYSLEMFKSYGTEEAPIIIQLY